MAQKRKTTRKTKLSLPNGPKAGARRAKRLPGKPAPVHYPAKAKQPQAEPTTSYGPDLPLIASWTSSVWSWPLIGLVTLFGLLSVNNGWLMGSWVTLLGRLFGWGVYFVPIGLIVFGGWLILRKFDRLPNLSPEHGLGISMLFLTLARGHALCLDPRKYRNLPPDGF